MHFLQQVTTPKPYWLELIPTLSAVIAIFGGILMFYLNKWWEARQNRSKKEDEEDEVHTSAIVKLSELSKTEREQLRLETKALHEKEINFYIQQIRFKDEAIIVAKKSELVAKRGELVARLKAHKLANDINKVKLYVQMVEQIAEKFDLNFPKPEFYTPDPKLLESEERELNMLTEAINLIDSEQYDLGKISMRTVAQQEYDKFIDES
jgi:hypothetical protein